LSRHPFEYHKPTEEQAGRMTTISESCGLLYDQLIALVPSNAERTLAIRSLQLARMWANAAILEIDSVPPWH